MSEHTLPYNGKYRTNNLLVAVLLGIASVNASSVYANPIGQPLQTAQVDNAATTGAASPHSTATIKRVDDKRRKLLLQHGPIENLGMSPMTMGFDVAPGVDITGLNAGDNILFRAEQIKGQYTVTEIRKP